MKKVVVIYLFLSFFNCMYSQNPATGKIIQQIFGREGLNFKIKNLPKINLLIEEIKKAPKYTLLLTTEDIINKLKLELNTISGTNIDERFKKFLTTNQIEHLSNYKKDLEKGLSFKEKIIKLGFIALQKIKNFFNIKTKNYLSNLILNFIRFEYRKIFKNYKKTLRYFTLQKKIKLPQIISFYNSNKIQRAIIDYSKTKKMNIKVQFFPIIIQIAEVVIDIIISILEIIVDIFIDILSEVVEELASLAGDIFDAIGSLIKQSMESMPGILIQSTLMAGGQYASMQLTKEEQQKLIAIAKKQKAMLVKWRTYKNKLKDNQNKIIKKLENNYSNQSNIIQKKYESSINLFNKEKTYLFKNIELDKPQMVYLIKPIFLDQIFEYSIMPTPQLDNIWHNLNQQGNWLYDPQEDSFTQCEEVDFNPNYASNNSIFTEYYTSKKEYEIKIEFTLIKYSYPFFAGLIFNKARWISGDPEIINQYRLIGIYGIDENNIDLHFAEQKLETSGKKEKILNPIKQITSRSDTTILEKINPKEIKPDNPATFILSIITSAKTVKYSIYKKGAKPTQLKTINNVLKDYIFKYAGIGFISSGCITEFKILKPKALTQK